MTFVGSVQNGFPKSDEPGLYEREYVLLYLDDTLVEICLVLDEEGLEVGGIDVRRALMDPKMRLQSRDTEASDLPASAEGRDRGRKESLPPNRKVA